MAPAADLPPEPSDGGHQLGGAVGPHLGGAAAHAAAQVMNTMIPLIAGGAMAFSSVFVLTNSLRLRRSSAARD